VSRVKLPPVRRRLRSGGLVAAAGARIVSVKRASDDTTWPVYTQRVGGSAVTYPVVADSEGEFAAYADMETVKVAFHADDDVVDNPAIVELLSGEDLAATTVTTAELEVAKPFVYAADFGIDESASAAANSTAIQAAIDSLPADGGTIVFPAGSFDFTTLDVSDTRSVRFIGAGGLSGGATTGTRLNSTATGSGRIIDARSSFGFAIADIMLTYSGAFTGIYIDYGHSGSALDASYMTLQRCVLTGSGVRGAAALVDLSNAIIGNFEDCVFSQAARGVRGRSNSTHYSNAMTFRGCTFLANVTQHVTNPSQAWSFYGCTFENLVDSGGSAAGAGALTFDSGCSASGVTFDGCWFGDCTAAGNWITFAGSGLSVRGCYMARSSVGAKAIAISGSSNTGIHISANQFVNFTTAVDLGTGQARCMVLGNDYQTVTTPIAAGDNPPQSVLEYLPNDSGTVGLYLGGILMDATAFALGGRFAQLTEQADPAAPPADNARLYARDNGSGKTQLCVRFSSGAVQVLATQP
jgi:hypothetical protein